LNKTDPTRIDGGCLSRFSSPPPLLFPLSSIDVGVGVGPSLLVLILRFRTGGIGATLGGKTPLATSISFFLRPLSLGFFSRLTVTQLHPPTSAFESLSRSHTKQISWLDLQPATDLLCDPRPNPQRSTSNLGQDPFVGDHGFQARPPNSRGSRPQDSHGVWRKESARPPPKATGAPETAKEVGLSPDNPRHGSSSGFGRPWSFDTEINDAVVENALPRGRGRGAGPLDNGSGIHRGSSGFPSRPAPARSVGS
jgi:hypothetical protein